MWSISVRFFCGYPGNSFFRDQSHKQLLCSGLEGFSSLSDVQNPERKAYVGMELSRMCGGLV